MNKILIVCGESYELISLYDIINYLIAKDVQVDIIRGMNLSHEFTIPEDLKKCNIVNQINCKYNFVLITGNFEDHLNLKNQNIGFIGHGGLADENSRTNFVQTTVEKIKNLNGYYLALNERLLNQSSCKGIVIGWPKIDILIGSHGETSEKKKLLLAGHWSNEGLWHNIGINLLYELFYLKEKYDICVTAHQRLFNDKNRCKDYNLGRVIRHFCEDLEINYNFEFNILDLIDKSNIIISDVSSLTCECSVMNKPIIWYNGNKKYNDEKLEFLIKEATYECNKTSEIIDFLKKDLQPKTSKLKNLSSYCFANIGHANENLKNFINKFLLTI